GPAPSARLRRRQPQPKNHSGTLRRRRRPQLHLLPLVQEQRLPPLVRRLLVGAPHHGRSGAAQSGPPPRHPQLLLLESPLQPHLRSQGLRHVAAVAADRRPTPLRRLHLRRPRSRARPHARVLRRRRQTRALPAGGLAAPPRRKNRFRALGHGSPSPIPGSIKSISYHHPLEKTLTRIWPPAGTISGHRFP